MSRHDDTVSLRHMLDYAAEAVSTLGARTVGDIEADRVRGLALVRLVEVVGEAATRVSAPTRAAIPDIEWRGVTSTRSRLIHGYDTVNLGIVWRVIREELPPLIRSLERELAERGPPTSFSS